LLSYLKRLPNNRHKGKRLSSAVDIARDAVQIMSEGVQVAPAILNASSISGAKGSIARYTPTTTNRLCVLYSDELSRPTLMLEKSN